MSAEIPNPKSMICKEQVFKGSCQRTSCDYAHAVAELEIGFLPGSLANYKTQACSNLEKKGKCIFSAGCYYYHCPEEKREPGKPKRGTPCPFFSKTGKCYYLQSDVPESCPYDHA